MRYCKSFKDGKYSGKAKCNIQEVFEKWLADTEYIHVEITEEEYNSL